MDLISIILIAIGLAMDCFAVSIGKGICVRKFHFGYVFRMALLFGLFQGIMPLIGYFIGSWFSEQIKIFDHWIALILLGFVGGKMIIESFKKEEEECCDNSEIKSHFKWGGILSLAIATSIDALATGVIFVPYPEIIWIVIFIIGFTSLVFSFTGYLIGMYFGSKFKFNAELFGGIVLVGIGLKIWIEHMYFS